MRLDEALEGRRSVRKYETRSISRDLVLLLLEAAEMAPSAGNLRARVYIAVTKPEMRKVLALGAYSQSQAESAPLLIVICSDVERSSRRYGDRGSLYSIQDAAAATMCLLLKAYDLGLGACWIGAFDEDIVREALDLENFVVPVTIVSLGWPAERPLSLPKRGNEEVVSWIE
ncbi:MAG: nitroreductase family protein [Methanotrichaceae archaeon]|nr:nitroreductase family protein [Methanotrichaceae archaeon]